jgi:hypothetical protein
MVEPLTLLCWKRKFKPRKVGETVPLSFEVPPGIDCLEIRCRLVPGFCRDAAADREAVYRAADRYALQAEPLQQLTPDEIIRMRGMDKLLTAVANLLNVTVHDPSGRYVGRWDAPDKESAPPVFLSASGSSPGFVATGITPGMWRLVVEAWYVFHDPAVATLEVLGHQAESGPGRPQAHRARRTGEPTQAGSLAPTRGGMLQRGRQGLLPSRLGRPHQRTGGGNAVGELRSGPAAVPGQEPASGPELPARLRSRHAAGASVRKVRGINFCPPRIRMPGVFVGEMHAHSRHSDGVYGVDEQAERAAALGLDFVALTDHNTTSGHAEFSPDAPVVQIPGEEMTTFFGHFCNYGVTRCHEWHDLDGRQRIREAIAEATSEGALPSLAHPHAIDPPACVGCGFRKGTVPYRQFRLLEVWSGAWKVRSPEIIATRALWDLLWSRGTRLVPIAARDWHSERQEDSPSVRFPVTAVIADACTPQGILAAVRAGRVFATAGPMVRFSIESEGRTARIGESLSSAAWALSMLEVQLEFPERTSGLLSILGDGRQVAACTIDGTTGASLRFETGRKGRYRVEVWSSDGDLLLLTNHITLG